MKLLEKLAHFILPHESNNLKAKILQTQSLFLLTAFLIFYQLTLSFLPRVMPQILGYAANIPPSEVIRLSNEKRLASGLGPLEESPVLSQAALAKGADMLARGYWAHVAPDGTQPWQFFTNAGYKYRYAGENLARDFSNPSSAVDAWMASASHKDNLLSPKYKEIGVAVVEGSLAGVETTVIVQFFGTKLVDTIPAVPVVKAEPEKTAVPAIAAATPKPTPIPTLESSPSPEAVALASPLPSPTPLGPRILVSPFHSTRTVSIIVVGFLILLLSVDLVVVSHRKFARVAGRTFAHLAFFGMVLTILVILKAGQIL